jgi:hypothetical protein
MRAKKTRSSSWVVASAGIWRDVKNLKTGVFYKTSWRAGGGFVGFGLAERQV